MGAHSNGLGYPKERTRLGALAGNASRFRVSLLGKAAVRETRAVPGGERPGSAERIIIGREGETARVSSCYTRSSLSSRGRRRRIMLAQDVLMRRIRHLRKRRLRAWLVGKLRRWLLRVRDEGEIAEDVLGGARQ
jgi:hypothetical protein